MCRYVRHGFFSLVITSEKDIIIISIIEYFSPIKNTSLKWTIFLALNKIIVAIADVLRLIMSKHWIARLMLFKQDDV